MGLLEKAEKIQTEDKVDVTPAPVVAAVAEPELQKLYQMVLKVLLIYKKEREDL